jgi:hypothetical protein
VKVDQETIAQFLRELKELISTGRNFYFIERPKNNFTLRKLGLTWSIFIKELLGLSVVDYCSGPDQDRDIPGDVWMFGKEINGHEIYIKLKIFYIGSEKNAKCISFHEADHPIKYPIRT